ncbi:MAG: LPS export ABC transporter permease LptG [Alphaproteobacteria bacterium]
MSTRTLRKYFAMRLVFMILIVYMVCVALVFFIDFVEMMREGAKVDASALSVALLTLLRLPFFAEMILPFSVLIGSIGTFLILSRSSELVIVRASGVSVWQFLVSAVVVAALFGVFAATVYNPLAARAKVASDRMFTDTFAKRKGNAKNETAAWLRQNGPNGPSIIHARASADRGTTLGGVTVLQFDPKGKFIERVEADKAILRRGYWELSNAHIFKYGLASKVESKYSIKTYLNPMQVSKSVDNAESVSFWELPSFIEFAEKAGLDTTAYRLQYQQLLSRPFMMIVMVLLAATCSLRPFRFGKIQTMVITGLSAGFAFFVLVELSRKLGMSGYVTAGVAVWTPIAMGTLLALTVLLHQEDG